jgi:hypothetical protein
MLKITIPAIEQYDEVANEFTTIKEQVLQLEHSLISLSKWESKWHKPFIVKGDKTPEETRDYIQCMTTNQGVDPRIYSLLNDEVISVVKQYMDDPMTATIISKQQEAINREIITAEIIYYWMFTLNIPLECQKWHLNKLLTQIDVCSIKNQPAKKRGRRELMQRNSALNKERRRALNTKG